MQSGWKLDAGDTSRGLGLVLCNIMGLLCKWPGDWRGSETLLCQSLLVSALKALLCTFLRVWVVSPGTHVCFFFLCPLGEGMVDTFLLASGYFLVKLSR